MGVPVYHLRDVEKVRRKGGVSFTLRIADLMIQRGEFVSVVGPSGCGKSTLLDLLALVLKPDKSEIFNLCTTPGDSKKSWDVPSLSESEAARIRRKNIGYVLQNGGLLPFLTVRENIMITAEISGSGAGGQELADLVRVLGLADQLPKKPQHLSGGQRQRVAVARALIHHPAIILADEPTAAVDYPTALEIRDELRALAHKVGATVIMVTHDHSLIRDIADAQVDFMVARKTLTDTVATLSVTRQR